MWPMMTGFMKAIIMKLQQVYRRKFSIWLAIDGIVKVVILNETEEFTEVGCYVAQGEWFDEGHNNEFEIVHRHIFSTQCVMDGVVQVVIMNETEVFIELYLICGP